MKKIILTTLMALSFQSIAQTPSLEMNKILEPSREEQEKRHYKELNDKMLKLKHNENATLITEEQCFEQAYEELKRTPISPDTNNLNSQFKGYDKQVRGLTKFTNSQGRGMSCKDTTIFYIMDAVNAVKRINESNIEKEKKIENMIKASDRANQEADEKFRKIEEEKEFNSNPKNFPYRETWYDYEKGIYEIKTYPIKNKKEIIEIANKNIDKFNEKLCPMAGMNKTFDKMHISEFDIDTIYGLAVNINKVKYIKINLPFLEDFTLNVKEFYYTKYNNNLMISFEEESEYIEKIKNGTFEYTGAHVRDENMAARWNKAANLKNEGKLYFTYAENEIRIHIAPIVQKVWQFENYVRENNPEYIDYLIKSSYFRSHVPTKFNFSSIDNILVLSYCHSDNYITYGD